MGVFDDLVYRPWLDPESGPVTLQAYNGNTKTDPNGLPHNHNYANAILNRVGNGN